MTSSRHSTSEDRERRCTIMAMIIIVTFVIFNLVASINNFVEASFGEPNPTHEPMRFVWQRAAVFIGNLLICVNSSSNFCIYCLFGRRFRQMCVLIFCPCLVAKNLGYQSFMINANGTMRSTQGSDAGGAVSKDIMALRRLNHSNRALSSDHAVMHGSNGSSFRSKPSPATQRRKRSSDVLLLHHSGNKYTSRLCGTGSVTEQVV
uniref:Uncharacterized protein n=1 Tax=Plectus sambesii TaxID=2011161 RepID=A0A914VD52_9BILA